MISIKPVQWIRETVDVTDDVYYDGKINGIQLISIHEDSGAYSLYHHVGLVKPFGFQRNIIYNSLEDAMDAAEEKINSSILELIDMRDIKINELLNE